MRLLVTRKREVWIHWVERVSVWCCKYSAVVEHSSAESGERVILCKKELRQSVWRLQAYLLMFSAGIIVD